MFRETLRRLDGGRFVSSMVAATVATPEQDARRCSSSQIRWEVQQDVGSSSRELAHRAELGSRLSLGQSGHLAEQLAALLLVPQAARPLRIAVRT